MALIEKLEAIGDAIRAKTGGTELLTLDAMPQEIAAIETGGGGGDIPEEAFTISGDCRYRLAFNGWNWYIDLFKSKIKTNEITNANYMFRNSDGLRQIPFDINFTNTDDVDLSGMFYSCLNLEAIPNLGKTTEVGAMSQAFMDCQHIKEIPQSWVDNLDFTYLHEQKYCSVSTAFGNCYRLRVIPEELNKKMRTHIDTSSSSYTPYYQGYMGLYSLDELRGIPVYAVFSSNAFSSFVNYSYRMKNILFETNDDGTAKTAKWKQQTIDLSNKYLGYAQNQPVMLNNTDFTKADLINNTSHKSSAEAVAAMNSNPNWWTDMYEYSRYGKNSAIATINSLPDTSAYLAANGGTNTIKFKANAGMGYSLDGVNQKIGDLSAEEIAVATAKGWTVSLV